MQHAATDWDGEGECPVSGGIRLEGRLRALVFSLLRATGAPFLARHLFQRRRLTILLIHQQSPEQFERCIRALVRRYTIIPLGPALDALEAGSLSGLPDRPLVLTIDDGRASNTALIPSLKSYGVRPTVFIATGVVGTNRHFWWTELRADELARLQRMSDDDRIAELIGMGLDPLREHDEPHALSLDELAALASAADIAPHTRMHPVLTSCTRERMREEIAGSVSDVAALVGIQPRVFAYPNGELSDEVVEAVEECGLRFAVTTKPVLLNTNSDPLRLGRIFVRDDAGTSELIVFASGLHGALKRLLRSAR